MSMWCQNCLIQPVVMGSKGRLLRYCSRECRNEYQKTRDRRAALERLAKAGPGHKHCGACQTVKPQSEFHRDRRRLDGLYPWCKDCRRAYMGATRRTPPTMTKAEYDRQRLAAMDPSVQTAERRDRHLWRTFGITSEDYDRMLAAQGGVCAICRQPESTTSSKFGRVMWLAVDHDHGCCPGGKACGQCIRGLLCRSCNTGLGMLREDPALLERAAEYVRRPVRAAEVA